MQEQHGSKRLARLRRLVNAALALECTCVPFFASCAVLGLLLYGCRRLGLEWWWLAGGIALAAAFPVVWGWRALRGRWFNRADAAALMDEQLGLHAALSAREQWRGTAGRRSVSVPGGGAVVYVRLRAAGGWLAWLAGGAALIACGALLPLPVAETLAGRMEAPPSLTRVEKSLDELERMAQVDGSSVEPLREQLEALKRMSGEELYSHAGLEAADALKNKTASAMAALASQLQQAGAALEMADGADGKTGEDGGDPMQAFREAMKGLEQSGLKPGGELARQLQQMTGAAARELDPETLRRLQQQLGQNARQLLEMCEQCGMAAGGLTDENGQSGMALADGDAAAENAASGGVSRGRGDAPLTFHQDERELLETETERVENRDLSRAALGSAAGVELTAPTPDNEGAGGVERGGRASAPARGGEAVWGENLTPREQNALKGIFK